MADEDYTRGKSVWVIPPAPDARVTLVQTRVVKVSRIVKASDLCPLDDSGNGHACASAWDWEVEGLDGYITACPAHALRIAEDALREQEGK